jgi:hypothetical protein
LVAGAAVGALSANEGIERGEMAGYLLVPNEKVPAGFNAGFSVGLSGGQMGPGSVTLRA